jgi:hypothetical protein
MGAGVHEGSVGNVPALYVGNDKGLLPAQVRKGFSVGFKTGPS